MTKQKIKLTNEVRIADLINWLFMSSILFLIPFIFLYFAHIPSLLKLFLVLMWAAFAAYKLNKLGNVIKEVINNRFQ